MSGPADEDAKQGGVASPLGSADRKRSAPAFGGGLGARGYEPAGRAQPARVLVSLAAFVVGDERYALDIMRIKEIINPLPITRVPRSPPFVEGVIALRGAILPIVDLRKRFEAPVGPADRLTKYLIVSVEGIGERWIVGLIVDRVLEVIRIPREEIREAPAFGPGGSASDPAYFSGVCRHRDRIVMLLHLDAILSQRERLSLAGLGEQPLLPPAPEPASDHRGAPRSTAAAASLSPSPSPSDER